MVEFIKQSSEVYISNHQRLSLQKSNMHELIHLAGTTERSRTRLCCHENSDEPVHEMFIIHPMDAYVRPHKHINKCESMLVLEGEVDYVIFDDLGEINEVISMGDYQTGKSFYQTVRTELFHTLLIRSEWLVFLEITKGPFHKNDTVFADWSPTDLDVEKIKEFIKNIEEKIR